MSDQTRPGGLRAVVRSGERRARRWLLACAAAALLGAASCPASPPPDECGSVGPAGNLLANPSFEQGDADAGSPAHWRAAAWGTNLVRFTWADSGLSGSRSARIDVAADASGNARWIPDSVPVSPGLAYVYQDSYRSSAPTRVMAEFEALDGGVTFLTLGTVPPSGDWALAVFAVTPPAGTARLTVDHVLGEVGSLSLDDASLVQQAPDLGSGVPNGSFEQGTGLEPDQPLAWGKGQWGSNTAAFGYDGEVRCGLRSAVLTVSDFVSGDAKWYFNPVEVTPRARYLYRDAFLSSVPSFVTARFTLTGGGYSYLKLGELPAAPFYTAARFAFVAPPRAAAVTVFHGLARDGTLRLDDVGLAALPPVPLVGGVPNGDLEAAAFEGAGTPAGWASLAWGTMRPFFSWTRDGRGGTHGLRVEVTRAGDASAAAGWYFDVQPVEPGQTYAYGERYRSDVDTSVVAEFTSTDGRVVSTRFQPAFAAPAWAQYRSVFAAPLDAAFVTVFHRISAVGSLDVDDVTLAPTAVAPLKRALVSLTFDDSWLSDYTEARPLLRARGMPATHYVITGMLGRPDRLSYPMLAELRAQGDEIASHTVHHDDLTTLAPEAVLEELTGSKQDLEAHGLGPIRSFASPYGAYDAATLAAIEDVYATHRATDVGFNFASELQPSRLKVQDVRSTTTAAEVDAWAAEAAATRSWLILVYHDVAAAPPEAGDYRVTPAALAAHLAALAARGLPVVTVGQALDEVNAR